MAITRISQSSVKEGLEKYTSFYGGLSGALFGQYESIATISVGSGGAASMAFSSIPSTYQHLQLRLLVRGAVASTDIGLRWSFNTDTSSNKRNHELRGDGSSATASSNLNTVLFMSGGPAANQTSGIFGAVVTDILDYANTSKNTVLRTFSGRDYNGSGYVFVESGLWVNTEALNYISIAPNSGNFAQHSTAALYGIKAP